MSSKHTQEWGLLTFTCQESWTNLSMPGKAQIWEKLRFGRAEQQANSLFCSETSPSTASSPSCLASGASGGKSQDLSSTSLGTTRLTDSVAYCECRLCICTPDLHWPLWGGMENRTKEGDGDCGCLQASQAAGSRAHLSPLESSLPQLLTAWAGWSGIEWQLFIFPSLEPALMRYAD